MRYNSYQANNKTLNSTEIKQFFKFFLLSVFFITTIFFGFFVYYTEKANKLIDLPPELIKSDAFNLIVVLAGGQGRISQGFELTAQWSNSLLYISGTDPHYQFKNLESYLQTYKIPADRIYIDRISRSTYENATVLADFIKKSEVPIHQILMITSRYHMQRSLLIFGRTLPEDIHFATLMVESQNYQAENYLNNFLSFKIALVEFVKFLWAYLTVV